MKRLALISTCLMVSACMGNNSGVGPGVSSYYECSMGTKLRVTYLSNGALVSVGNARAKPFRSTPAVSGAIYEGSQGQRLARNGNDVTWNTAARTGPETCREIIVPR